MDAAAWLEAQAAETAKENAADIAKQKAAGIQVIEFKGADGEAFRAKAYETGWAGIISQEPRARAEAEGVLRQGEVSGRSRSADDGSPVARLRPPARWPDGGWRACCCWP